MRCLRLLRRGFLSMLPSKRSAGADGGQPKRLKVGESPPPVAAASNGSRNGAPPEIDEDLHSRQLAVYGRETMRRLFASDVFVSGLNGLGAEIAKNLALAGVRSVTVHDVKDVDMWDLSGNFFLSEQDIGKNRALACVSKLQELNNAVLVSALTEELTKEHLSKFQAVVFTDISLDKAYEFDDYCHSHQSPISFIKAEVCGLFASVFCDFGPEFTVLDVDGEDPHTGIIASISDDSSAMVSRVDDEWLEFQDGDLVVFSEVQGMAELNDGKPRKVKNARPFSFSIEEDTCSYGVYTKGGIVTQVKEPKLLHFKSLRDAMKDPGDFLMSDFSKFERSPVIHLAFQALDNFRKEHGRYPTAGCEQVAQCFFKFAADINEASIDSKLEKIDEELLRHFSSGSRAVLNPMAAMFGGIVGQEVVKACSGKFHPLYQFFYFDSVESLPTYQLDPQDLKPSNSRYDAQISVFGSKLQKKLQDANIFIVGSGALGCEFLKNLALMGVSCSSKSKLTITDDDVIEKSNLSRQFLFRDWNIGQAKSSVAAAAARAINPSLQIDALQNRACPDTEKFEGLLEKTPNEVNSFLSNPTQYAAAMKKAGDAQARELLERVSECLGKERCITFEDCITWARLRFEDYFSNRVKQLTFTFPEDASTSTGTPFWSAPKRFPRPLQFSATDSSHIHFITSASILRAESFGIAIPDWAKNTNEKATNLSSASVDDVAVIDDLLSKLEECAKNLPPGFQMKPIQFEKDDDTNFHMDLIFGFANLRARNYSIPEVDKLKAKFIAGRIIPAIAEEGC
ncbi:Ubiquitin-activating enzyme E1 3 [Panicum miliaceum]|uniref:E1 ubiquitin-activating enzyme n=1 Tax=Panicum miliaceum TaxID=4540 RepID=A0A3L6QTE2_PANMI|nr:Ubiquitin-activating enzyme E1 3 [Panicum miliaceum]